MEHLDDIVREIWADARETRETVQESRRENYEQHAAIDRRLTSIEQTVDRNSERLAEMRGAENASRRNALAAGGVAGVGLTGLLELVRTLLAGLGKG